MAYYIEYSPESAHRYPAQKRQRERKKWVWVMIAMIFASLLWVRLNGIPEWLIPGDPVVTKEAASLFMEELWGGAGMNDAVTTFCRTILDGAAQ